MEISVIGAGSWGTVLSRILADNGHSVTLWARSREKAEAMQASRRNGDYLPDMVLPASITVTNDLALAAKRASVLVFVVPSKGMKHVAQALRNYTDARDRILLSCTKGFEMATHALMTDVLAGVFPEAKAIAAPEAALLLQQVFINWYFRPYTSTDVIGVQLGGCVKNCYALVSGMMAGIGMGENCEAGLITRGLAEITRLGLAMGAQRETFSGLACIGDLIATCGSPLSRNRTAGVALASGKNAAEICGSTKMVIEGIDVARVVHSLALQYHVEMPILEELYRVLYEGKRIQDALQDAMTRKGTKE